MDNSLRIVRNKSVAQFSRCARVLMTMLASDSGLEGSGWGSSHRSVNKEGGPWLFIPSFSFWRQPKRAKVLNGALIVCFVLS